jgi:hypothetical protein
MGDMRLPDFITRALAFFSATETRLEKLEKTVPGSKADMDGDCDECEGTGKCPACDGTGKDAEGKACESCSDAKCGSCGGVGTAKGQVGTLKKLVASLRGLMTDSNKIIADSNALLTSKAAEIAKLTESLAVEKRRANEVLAAQGLPANAVPPAEQDPKPGQPLGEDAWTKYSRLLSENPRAAGAFWKDHANDILLARHNAAKA